MKNKILFVLFYLVCICLTEDKLILKFTKRHYVNPDSVKKIIEVTSSISNKLVTLNIENKANNQIKPCTPKNNDDFVFYCFISSIGEYKFSYTYLGNTYQYSQSIFVYSSYNALFDIIPSRNANCFYHKEIFSYIVKVKNKYKHSINLNNIQIFAYNPKSLIKQINSTEVLNFTRIVTNKTYATFTINSNHTRNQFIVRITENEDFDDTLGKIHTFSFTEVEIHDRFFFPCLKKPAKLN